MNLLWSSFTVLVLGLAGCAQAADPTNPPPVGPAPAQTPVRATAARLMPPSLPPVTSPVAFFRRLLSMPPKERESYLTNRPPVVRAGLEAKIKEYLDLDPDTRELRLRATELQWQLLPLLRTAPADRAARLAQVPEDLDPLVQSRLEAWDKLPSAVQQEFLASEGPLSALVGLSPFNPPAADSAAEARRENTAAQFSQFFALTPDEQRSTLKTISPTERAQMEATLEAFAKLTPAQRFQCQRAFAKFAGLTQAERTEFLKNAGRWAQMTPQERQTWRDLVAQVPSWPSPPPMKLPPLPPKLPSLQPPPVVATNRN
jgi:hypothetical protein